MKILGYLILIAAGLFGLFASLSIIAHELGFIGGFIAFLFFPVTLAFAPWYAGFAYGNWQLLGIIYGGTIVGSLLVGLGDKNK